MDELVFNFKKHLNIKKVIIVVLGIIAFILIIFFLILKPKETEPKDPNAPIINSQTNTTIFFNKENTLSLEFSNNYALKQYTPTNEYLIELRSDANLNVFISSKNLIEGKSLKDVVSADKLAFTESFSTVSNISELKEITINEHNGCTYSFHYLDENLNTTFYIQVTWMEFNGIYYVFDIEFPLNDLNNYINIVTDTISGFNENASFENIDIR